MATGREVGVATDREGGVVMKGVARERAEGVVMNDGPMLVLWIRWRASVCTSDAVATFPPTTPASSAGTPLVENLARSAD